MFGTLAFVTVRQKHDEAAHAKPLGLTRSDELIDDDLRAVGEVAKLRFPERERLGLGRRIAVFEPEHRFFRQQGVDDLEARLTFAHMLQRVVAGLVFLIAGGGRTLPSRAFGRIPARQPDRYFFGEPGAKSKSPSRRPKEVLAP